MLKRNIIWIGLSAAVFLFVWQQIQSVRYGYELEKVRRQTQAQREKNALLRSQVEALCAPDRLAAAAKERLGMLPPNPDALVMLGAPEQGVTPQGVFFLSRSFAQQQ